MYVPLPFAEEGWAQAEGLRSGRGIVVKEREEKLMRKLIPVNGGGPRAALIDFLRAVLAREDVDAVFTPARLESGAVTHALITDPELLDRADPLAPILPRNGAPELGALTLRGGVEGEIRIAAVMRPCEIRALVELVKLKQASLGRVTVIGVDCPGTYSIPDFLAGADGIPEGTESGAPVPAEGAAFRDACAMCEHFTPDEIAGARIALFGANLEAGLPAELPEAWEDLPFAGAPEPAGREEAVERLREARIKARDEAFEDIRARLQSETVAGVFSACIHCMNCQRVCPVCYCRECVMCGPLFRHGPDRLARWAERKGALRMPPDTALFHLTRLNHMAVNCIGCGMCTEACPAELPVGRVFRAVGAQTGAQFDYEAGRSMDDPLPLVTFREDEWTEIGEE